MLTPFYLRRCHGHAIDAYERCYMAPLLSLPMPDSLMLITLSLLILRHAAAMPSPLIFCLRY